MLVEGTGIAEYIGRDDTYKLIDTCPVECYSAHDLSDGLLQEISSMSITGTILLLVGSYLLGSFPYMFILARSKGVPVSLHEDFHLVLWRRVGRLEAISGILLDVLKGTIPVIIGFYTHFDVAVAIWAGILAAVGQMWPVFLKFNGEKGNTTGMGIVLSYGVLYQNYILLIVSIGIVLVGAFIRTVPRIFTSGQSLSEKMKLGGPASNSFPLAMILNFAAVPATAALTDQPVAVAAAFTTLFLAIVARRLTAGLLADLDKSTDSILTILLMRLLFDRSTRETGYQYYGSPDEVKQDNNK